MEAIRLGKWIVVLAALFALFPSQSAMAHQTAVLVSKTSIMTTSLSVLSVVLRVAVFLVAMRSPVLYRLGPRVPQLMSPQVAATVSPHLAPFGKNTCGCRRQPLAITV